jgi:hypothetical protein
MGQPHRRGDQLGEQSEVGVGLKKLRVEGKQPGIQELFNRREVERGVLGPGVVAVDEQGTNGQQKEKKKPLTRNPHLLNSTSKLRFQRFSKKNQVTLTLSRIFCDQPGMLAHGRLAVCICAEAPTGATGSQL